MWHYSKNKLLLPHKNAQWHGKTWHWCSCILAHETAPQMAFKRDVSFRETLICSTTAMIPVHHYDRHCTCTKYTFICIKTTSSTPRLPHSHFWAHFPDTNGRNFRSRNILMLLFFTIHVNSDLSTKTRQTADIIYFWSKSIEWVFDRTKDMKVSLLGCPCHHNTISLTRTYMYMYILSTVTSRMPK